MKVDDLRPLLAAMTLAEEISRDVALRQAALAPAALAGTLALQGRQEALHAAMFRGALQGLPGTAPCPAPVERALLAFRQRLMADLDDGCLAQSMLGLQCVLERLACVALEPPPGELARLADRTVPLRSFVLHQESAHRTLGDVWVPRLADPGAAPLQEAGEEYVGLALEVLDAGLRTLPCLAQDAAHYRATVRRELHQVVQRLATAALT